MILNVTPQDKMVASKIIMNVIFMKIMFLVDFLHLMEVYAHKCFFG